MDYLDPKPPPTTRGGCGKAVYRSHGAAKAVMRSLQRHGKGQSYRGRLHPYVCKVCRAWHVGHSNDGADN